MRSRLIIERRKHKRFKAQEGAFAVLRPQFTKLGQIIDISKGGLAFLYIATEDLSNGSSEMDILLAGNGFYCDKVPIKTIADLEIPKESPFESIKTRRLSVQFGELKDQHLSQLEYFIENHTTGEVGETHSS